MEKINVLQPIYFYDDRSKYDWMLKLKSVLFIDEDTCLCLAQCTDETAGMKDEKILFNIQTGEVLTADYYSWIATNDVEWAEQEDERIRLRAMQ